MKKALFYLIPAFLLVSSPASAFWVWTPETRQWINPKYAVKETPQKQLEYAMEAVQAEDYRTAEQELNKLLRYYPKAREAAEAQFHLAGIQEKQGDFAKAFKSYETVIQKYPFTDRANEVVRRLYEMASGLLEGRGERRPGFWASVVQSGANIEAIFASVIKNAPYGEYAAPAQYKIGLFLKEEGLLQEARDAFEKTLNDYPQSEWAEAARFQIALADAERSAGPGYDQQITEQAIQGFKEFSKEFPETDLSQEAQVRVLELKEKEAESHFLVAQFYEKQKNFEAAGIYYSMIVDEYKDTDWAVKALKRLEKMEGKQ